VSRFSVAYRIAASDAREARTRAEGIAREQTVEVPADVVPPGFVADEIVGHIEELGRDGAPFAPPFPSAPSARATTSRSS
jgi:ribulose-bisphosphate carboxylase large chain